MVSLRSLVPSLGVRILPRQRSLTAELISIIDASSLFIHKLARSSSGLGRWPLTPVTGVRLPYALRI